jgi:hypothetical protein
VSFSRSVLFPSRFSERTAITSIGLHVMPLHCRLEDAEGRVRTSARPKLRHEMY